METPAPEHLFWHFTSFGKKRYYKKNFKFKKYFVFHVVKLGYTKSYRSKESLGIVNNLSNIEL